MEFEQLRAIWEAHQGDVDPEGAVALEGGTLRRVEQSGRVRFQVEQGTATAFVYPHRPAIPHTSVREFIAANTPGTSVTTTDKEGGDETA
ncbi:MAG TPA: hypothetical protein VHQ86_01630 [Candidatus Saccharimonadia bacterium]|nr:hypothetical protein [Candidatus Saccharimonadia bacterium]